MAARPAYARRMLRWVVRLGVAAAILAGLIALATRSGLPQAWAANWAAQAYLGAVVEVDWARTVSPARIRRLALYPDRDAQARNHPVAVAEDIAITYAVNPTDKRWIREVTVGSVWIHADASDPERPNYAFLQKLLEAPEREEPADTRFWPLRVVIGELNAAARFAKAFVSVTGLEADARLDTAETMSGGVSGASTEVTWWVKAPEAGHRLTGVTLNVTGSLAGVRASWDVYAEAPDLFRTALHGTGDFGEDGPYIEARMDESWASGELLREYASPFASPVYSDELRVAEARASTTLSQQPEYSVMAEVRANRIFLPGFEEPLYGDTLAINARASGGEMVFADATATFAQGQRLTVSAQGRARDGAVTVTIDEWAKDEFVAVLPAAFQESVAPLGFDTFSAQGEAYWEDSEYTVNLRAESSGGEAMAPPISWTLDAEGSLEEDAPVEGTFAARLGERSVRASGRYVDENHYQAEAHIEQVAMTPWLRFAVGAETAERVHGTIEGTIEAHVEGKDAPMEIRPELTVKDFIYETVALEHVDVTGVARYDMVADRVTLEEARADTVDGLTYASLRNWAYGLVAREGGGEVELSADLGIVGRIIGLPDLFGSGSLSGSATLSEGDFEYLFTMHSDYLGYGDLLIPYGAELTGEGTLRYDLDAASGTLDGLTARLGEGTELRMTETRFALDPVRAEGDLSLNSDLQIAVEMMWAKQIEGKLAERTKFRVTDEGLFADWDLQVDAPTLVLPEDAGFAENVRVDARGIYRDGLEGTGTVFARRVSAGGGSIWNVEGPARLDGSRMRLYPVRGTVFDGSIEADIDVGVLEAGLPVFLTAEFDNVDLAMLTEEVQPPNTRLTGRARGNLSVDYAVDALRGFTVEAEAPKGLTVNRSLVADLLQSEKLLAGMGERVAERAMDKILGEKPQRPFDRGRLYVYLVGDTIQGQAELKSEKTADYHGLNLTVNLDMDVSALAEGLQLLEESALADVEF